MQIHALDRAKMLLRSYYVLRSSQMHEEGGGGGGGGIKPHSAIKLSSQKFPYWKEM